MSTAPTTFVPAPAKEGLSKTEVDARSIKSRVASSTDDDDQMLVDQFGYVPSFKREFSSLATVRARSLFRTSRPHKPHRQLDQFCVQHHGPLLQCRDDVQHAALHRGPRLRGVVLDPRCLHVLHARCVRLFRVLSHALPLRAGRLGFRLHLAGR